MLNRLVVLALFILLVLPLTLLHAEETQSIQSDDVIVHFDPPLQKVAEEVIGLYPAIKADLEKTLGWRVGFRPTVMLMKDREAFQRMAGNTLVVAYAVSPRNLIVIDYSKMNTHPFSLGVTLKHELCHLLLHHHIRRENLPKWLDEGISQWTSDGIAELFIGGKAAIFKRASLSGRLIDLRDLSRSFPGEAQALSLAYEESKSIVEYINGEFGTSGLLKVLDHLRGGERIDTAVQKALSIPLDQLEERWHASLTTRITWFIYFSNNLYSILFFLAALALISGFVRFLIRKRAYKDDEENWE